MARRKQKPTTPAPATKSMLTLPLPSSPDARKDSLAFLGLGIDPVEQFHREKDLFARREILWRIYRGCSAMRTIGHSIGSELASQEITITPLETNPSGTTLLNAKRNIDLINNAMNRPGGIVDFIINVIDGYWGSKTGAFILTPRDSHGNILSIGVIPPNLPRPYYGFSNNGQEMMTSPLHMQNLTLADGIWFIEPSLGSSNYFVLPSEHYFQICYGSYAYGAFQDGEPPAEQQISPLVTHIAVSDYMRKTVMCTDESQIIVTNNIDTKELKAKSDMNKELAKRRREGIPVNPEDEGLRTVVSARDVDKPASITVANLRAFPADFNPEETLTRYEQRIALGFGVHPRRAAADIQKERFGNAAQASMLNTDEPGVSAIKTVLKYFIGSVMMGGLPLRAEFTARNTPENYWTVDRDMKVAQVIQQLGTSITPEIAQNYLLRNGVIEPKDLNQPSVRAEDGTPVAQGWVTLKDRIGHILTYEGIQESFLTLPVSYEVKAVAPEFQPCADVAIARYQEWMKDELPTVIQDSNGMKSVGYYALRQEVDDITVEVYHDLIQCAKKKGARSGDPKVRALFDVFKAYFYNLFGSPALQQFSDVKPKLNLFNDLWGLAGAIAMGRASEIDLQTSAAKYVPILSRYANATRAVAYMVAGLGFKGTGGVDWVLGEVENHCGMCPSFAQHYTSFDQLISHTGGLLPGDVRLQCAGNCKCHLEFHP